MKNGSPYSEPRVPLRTGRGWRTVLVRLGTVALAAFLLGLVLVGLFWLAWTAGPDSGDVQGSSVRVRIQRGMTLGAVADTLAARGLLNHPQVFLAGTRLQGLDRRLQAGLYDLPVGASPRELLRYLTSGLTVRKLVTVPEGLEADEVAALLAGELGVSAAAVLAAADSLIRVSAPDLLGSVARLAGQDSLIQASVAGGQRRLHWCEGYLAPDTYQFAEGVGAGLVAEVLVKTQLARLDSCLADIERQGWPGQGHAWSPHDLLTLASIVEAEAQLPRERPLVAAVYLNRLFEAGWRLEADPTVAYFLAKKGQRLYYKDLARKSPYNTYRHFGLPPGPIGNPGLAAIRAVCRPDTSCRALFFVADGEGGHVFSLTSEEHEAAVARLRRLRSRN